MCVSVWYSSREQIELFGNCISFSYFPSVLINLFFPSFLTHTQEDTRFVAPQTGAGGAVDVAAAVDVEIQIQCRALLSSYTQTLSSSTEPRN